MRVVKFELKRAFQSIELKLSVLIGLIIAGADIFIFYKRYHKYSKVVSQSWLGTDFFLPYGALFCLLIPLLGALPFAGSYFRDIKSGYIKNICVKCSRRQYFFAKSVAVFISGAVAIIIPFLLDLYICMGLYPMREAELQLADSVFANYTTIFADVFAISSVLYILCYIFLDGIIAGILALFAVCISDYVKSFFSVVTFPFVFTMLLSMAAADEGGYHWSVVMMLYPIQGEVIPRIYYYITMILGLGIAVCILSDKSERKDIL